MLVMNICSVTEASLWLAPESYKIDIRILIGFRVDIYISKDRYVRHYLFGYCRLRVSLARCLTMAFDSNEELLDENYRETIAHVPARDDVREKTIQEKKSE